jgi:hypothetical protein
VAGRYEVRLPFQSERRPDMGRGTAERRLVALERSLAKHEGRKETYDAYFRDLCERGIVELVGAEHEATRYFLPHHGVWKGGKLRVVFDGSAGLNDHVYTGPNLVKEIVRVLSNARLGPQMLSGDIKSAFLMVGVHLEDRKFLGFLWGGKEWRFRRVVFGLSCSPFLLQHVLRHMCSEFGKEGRGDLVRGLQQALYVDDICLPLGTGEDVATVRGEVKAFLRSGGMELHKVRVVGDPGVGGLLGVRWDSAQDTLQLEARLPDGPRRLSTKREVLRAFAGIYDPLGWLSPWSLGFRIPLQGLWARDLGWDQPLDEETVRSLRDMADGAESVRQIALPRHVGHVLRVDVYVDASPKAYAACVITTSRVGESHLLLARARVAPRKPELSLPRLELLGAVLGIRLFRKVSGLFSEDVQTTFWCDSTIALAWITAESGSRWKLFVQNRVTEIRQTTEAHQWRKIASASNPADLATRGISGEELRFRGELWWRGPQSSEQVGEDELTLDEETRAAVRLEQLRDPVVTACPAEVRSEEPFAKRFSSLARLVRAAAWARRWLPRGRPRRGGALRHGEKEEAFRGLLRQAQEACLGPEGPGERRVLRDGVAHGRTRTGECLPVLPEGSHLSVLVVEDRHRKLFHQATSATLAEVQRTFVGVGRRAVKKVLSPCLPCRKNHARKCRAPEAALPAERVDPVRPFAHVGMDFFGPIFVRREGKRGTKAYVLLVTCAVTRGFHLEAVSSMSAEDTALALRRVVARRGTISVVFCDNAKAFKKLATLVGASFRFLPERSPAWGGFYERLVGTVKRALKATLGGAALSFEEAATILAELQERLNRRPLMASGPGEAGPLTPAHFLYGAEPPALGPGQGEVDPDADGLSLQRRLAYHQRVGRDLWVRWRREYLPTLRSWRTRGGGRVEESLRKGELVLVDDGILGRGRWPLARVEEPLTGADGRVRAVWIRLRGRRTRRPVSRLLRLEAANEQGAAAAAQAGAEPTGAAAAAQAGAEPATTRGGRRDTYRLHIPNKLSS